MKLIFATHNPGKIKEMRQILVGLPVEIVSAEEAGVFEDVVEDGKTFAENALKKARFVAKKTGEWTFADDSGTCIKALNGAPGVDSKRWAGDPPLDQAIVAKTLHELRNVPEGKRDAWFETCVALVSPEGKEWTFSGACEGSIALAPQGPARPTMPYDVIFLPKGMGRSYAELSDDEKNALSHRGQAFRKLKDFLQTIV